MHTTIQVRGKKIDIQFEEHIVHLTNNNELESLLAQETEAATDELVTIIKAEYHKLFNKELDVSDASYAVEIWAHVYVEKFADAVKSISSFSLIDNIADKVIYHCEVIDTGEFGHDNNRFVWNSLAPFKSIIAGLLPKK